MVVKGGDSGQALVELFVDDKNITFSNGNFISHMTFVDKVTN